MALQDPDIREEIVKEKIRVVRLVEVYTILASKVPRQSARLSRGSILKSALTYISDI